MIYGYSISFNESKAESLSPTINVVEAAKIDTENLPVTLVYQNNQERQITLMTDRENIGRGERQPWVFEVEGVIRFGWNQDAQRIVYQNLELATDAIREFWLYHVVLPIYLSLHQVYKFLHAGAVEADGHAVLFMAPSHAGKSTLTDYFLQRGHPLITDDKMATYEHNGVYYAVPSHPYHRPFRTVEVLGHRSNNTADGVKPIRAIYILKPRDPEAECFIRELKGVEKFSRLHEGGEMNFSFFTPEYVRYLGALANTVSIFSVDVPHDLERLGEVYDVILGHLNTYTNPVVINLQKEVK